MAGPDTARERGTSGGMRIDENEHNRARLDESLVLLRLDE